MSFCKQEGKDRIIFVTKEDHEAPSNAELIADDPHDPYEEQGLILANGDINWNCPCLGGMASGPCGSQFKEAFSCFHYSQEEVKGSDCIEHFRGMQECMQKYPELYPQEDEKENTPQSGEDVKENTPQSGEDVKENTPQSGEDEKENTPQSGAVSIEEPASPSSQSDSPPDTTASDTCLVTESASLTDTQTNS